MTKKVSVTIVLAAVAVMLFSYLSPRGWHTAGSSEEKYDMGTIRYNGHNSKSCGTIKANKSRYFNDDYGLLMQTFSARKYLGKKLRMSGFMKTKGVDDWAGFMLRADKDGQKEPLTFDNMAEKKIKGNGDWQEYHIDLDIPANATRIAFGALLNGPGQIWFDDIQFEVIGNSSIAADSGKIDATLAKEPINLDFEL